MTETRVLAARANGRAKSAHVILLGVGMVGLEVLTRLRAAGLPVVAIDLAPSELAQLTARENDVEIIRGDITLPETMDRLRIDEARAFISCTNDDKANLNAALLVHDRRAELRTVVRLNNDHLAEQLESRFPNWSVLGLPALASPSFVSAALAPDTLRSWRIAGTIYGVAEIPVEETAMVRDHAGASALYIRRESGDVESWPPPPTPLQPGDRLGAVVDIGRLRELGSIGLDGSVDQGAPSRFRLTTRAIAAWLADADRRLLTALGLAIGLAWLSVFIFVEYKGLNLVAAMYFTVTTMATVGYGDINLLEDAPGLKLFGMALMLTSLFVVSVITAFVTNWVLSDRLSRLFGTTRTTAFDHVIICGLGNVGYRILEELRPVIPGTAAIDMGGSQSLATEALRSGATVITGDARQENAFHRANVHDARSVVIATSDDLLNLEIGLSAREANPRVRIIIRLFDEGFAARVRATFDVDNVLSPAAIAAPAFAAAAMGRSVVDTFTIEGATYVYVRVYVEQGSAWVGATVGDLLRSRDATAIVLEPAIGNPRVRPSPRAPLRVGDIVHLICAPDVLASLELDEEGGLDLESV
ncbi:MAG: hypothetical protein EPO26_02175 [Chloroflexota bacterium]|nr:MAG: hypothetical protein EPO26_02175 [Chloroflexota bacterium]